MEAWCIGIAPSPHSHSPPASLWMRVSSRMRCQLPSVQCGVGHELLMLSLHGSVRQPGAECSASCRMPDVVYVCGGVGGGTAVRQGRVWPVLHVSFPFLDSSQRMLTAAKCSHHASTHPLAHQHRHWFACMLAPRDSLVTARALARGRLRHNVVTDCHTGTAVRTSAMLSTYAD